MTRRPVVQDDAFCHGKRVPGLELQLFLKIHYRHRTGTTRMQINSDIYF